jgi:hypothetical protein
MAVRASGFPERVPVTAALGFVLSVASTYLGRGSHSVALMKGTMAVTATIIEAATRPIVQGILPNNNRRAALVQCVVPRLITCALALAIAPRFEMSYTTSLTAFAICSVVTYTGVALIQRAVSQLFLGLATVTAPYSDEIYQSGLVAAFYGSLIGLLDHFKGDVVSKEAMLFLF